MSPSGASGEAVFLERLKTIERVVTFVCRRNSLRDADAEDFGSWVKLKLIENGYAAILKFDGRNFVAYITTVIHRLLLDYRIQLWGKWHASAEARRLGEVAIALEVMVVRDGRSVDEALPALRAISPNLTRAEAEAFAARLPDRTPRPRFVGLEEVAGELTVSGERVEDVPLASERASLWRRIGEVVDAYLHRLDDESRSVLQLRFGAGLSVAEIARVLRIEQKPLYRVLNRHIAELRRRLRIAGIGWEKARDLLEHPPRDVDFTFFNSESRTPRPSDQVDHAAWVNVEKIDDHTR
jgi:RNA polymerase sigma factor (sigma-70 family)